MRKIIKTMLLLVIGICLLGLGYAELPQLMDRSMLRHETSVPEEGDAAKSTDQLTVHFIDVMQGDAVLITCGDEAMLIDAGGNDKGTAVQLYLESQGVSKLKYAIGTHLDADHIGGLDVVITKFPCETIIMPEYHKDTATYRDVLSAMAYKGYNNKLPVVGDTYTLGNADFTIIAPNRDYGNSENDQSVGLILKHGANRFLFTGDAGEQAEADILENGIGISCDVYHGGHHGSQTSSSDKLLDAADPEYAVISCGEGNAYGHPRAATLNEFRSRGIKVLRTDEQGTIVAVSDGEGIQWNTSPSTTWKAGEPRKNSAVTESDITYVLNVSTGKFHLTTCDSLPTNNRKDTSQIREEVLEEGYVPCKRCQP